MLNYQLLYFRTLAYLARSTDMADSSTPLLRTHKEETPISNEEANTEIKRSTLKDKFWVVAIYALIACIGTVVTGFSQGYTSSTFLQLEDIYNKGDSDHAFKQNSIYGSLFGVSSDNLCLYIYIAS